MPLFELYIIHQQQLQQHTFWMHFLQLIILNLILNLFMKYALQLIVYFQIKNKSKPRGNSYLLFLLLI